jgi:hypothetical protein
VIDDQLIGVITRSGHIGLCVTYVTASLFATIEKGVEVYVVETACHITAYRNGYVVTLIVFFHISKF